MSLSGTSNDLWAVGGEAGSAGSENTLAQHFNGSAWTTVPTPNGGGTQNQFQAVSADSTSDAWAVGFSFGSWSSSPLVAHWDGSAWSSVAVPAIGDSQLTGVTALAPDNAWAVGWERGSTTALIEHWDGSSWAVATSPDEGVPVLLQGMTALSATNIWAVGYVGTFASSDIVEHYNGTAWTVHKSADPGATINILTGVSHLGSQVWAVGAYGDSSSGDHTLIERLYIGSFVQVPSPNVANSPQSILAGVSGGPGPSLFAVGSYRIGSTYDPLIERWHAGAWHIGFSGNASTNGEALVAVISLGSCNEWAAGEAGTGTAGGPYLHRS